MRATMTWLVRLSLVALALALSSLACLAEPLIELREDSPVDLIGQAELLVDADGDLSPFEVLSNDHRGRWQAIGENPANRGYGDQVSWVRFRLDASRSVHKEWDLVIANPLLNYIDLYQVFDGSGPRLIHRTGMARPFDNRAEEHRFFVLPLEVYRPTTFLLRVESVPSTALPLRIYPADQFWAPLLQGDIGNWLFFGVILAMVTYNFFLYLTVRDSGYLWYVLFIASFGVLQLALDGYLYQYLWWQDRGYDYRLNYGLTILVQVFATAFILRFLDLGPVSRPLQALMLVVGIGLPAVFALLLPTMNLAVFGRLFSFNIIAFLILAVALGCYAWRKGLVAARYFVLAWTLFALGNILFLVSRNGWIDLPFPAVLVSKLGAFAEAMLLSFALGYRIRVLRQQSDRERLRAEAQSYFLAQISHEIRTPLNGVLGMTEILARTRLDEEQRGYVDTIQGSGVSLLTLINDILDYSKIEAGKMELHRESVATEPLIEQQVQLFRSQAEQKGLTITAEIGPDVPDQLVLDAQHLRQVLSNLLSNAIKFTDQGSVHLRVHTRHQDGCNRLVCRVRDTGIGIAPYELETLFNAYYQLASGRDRGKGGTGLGLAISRQLVALMGGDLNVTSEPGQGTEFVVEVPFDPAVDDPADGKVDSATGAHRRLTVLVAEDNLVNQKVIRGLLEKLGHRVRMVGNGEQALAERMAPTFAADLILMDCEMPGLDGYEATRRIRVFERDQERSEVPIIALTAHALEEVRQRCLDAGMTGFLTKPVNTRRLMRLLSGLD